jgi:hypothetical protein
MILGSSLCNSFKTELLRGVHNFDLDQFRLALYRADAELGAHTTFYTPDREAAGQGYEAGGQTLRDPQIHQMARAAFVMFDDAVWPLSAIEAKGALIYNQTKQRRAVAVLDFGGVQVSNQGEFRVRMPSPTPSTALIRLV